MKLTRLFYILLTMPGLFPGDVAAQSTLLSNDSTRVIDIRDQFLLIPVRNGAPLCHIVMKVGAEEFRNIDVELGTDTIDYYAWIDVSPYKGQSMSIATDDKPQSLRGLKLIVNKPQLPAGFYSEKNRLQLHYSPKVGWVNDPNGLFQYKGEWHLFYQHNPYGQQWGNMSWGHAVSKDLVHWDELPVALHSKKDMPGYAYSGSAIVDWKNKSKLGANGKPPILLYFSATHTKAGHEQWLVYSSDEGRTWKMYQQNPVVPNLGTNDRDPKVIWDESHGEFVMVLYQDDPAKFIFLTSPDLMKWTRKSDISFDMNECPDLFQMPVEGDNGASKWVLMSGHGKFFENDNWNYVLGEWDGTRFTPETGQLQLEQGIGNYSTQTWSDAPAGRRIFSGWLTRPFDTYGLEGMPANGQFRIPWEFKLKKSDEGLRLTALPVKEFDKLRGRVEKWKNLVINEGGNPTASITDSLLDINVRFKIGTGDSFGFRIMGQEVIYNSSNQTLTCFEYKGKPKTVSLKNHGGIVELRIIVDNGALEIFSPDGSFVMTGLFTKKEHQCIVETFTTGGDVRIEEMKIYHLESIWK